MNNFLLKAFVAWVPLAAVITGLCFVIYGVEQQHYRQELDDPQTTMVIDAQAAIMGGTQSDDVVKAFGHGQVINADVSQQPFLMLLDESGNVLESTATIGGGRPPVPEGVFIDAKADGQHNVTWQPSAGTRIALVIRPLAIESGWYIAAGRNMKIGEDHIARLGIITLIGWAVVLAGTFVAVIVALWLRGLTK